MQELRAAIGALAAEEADPVPHGVADLPTLIARNRDAGARIVVENEIPEDAVLPEAVDRTIYRMVQEGLTNAHKHAPNARVVIRAGLVDGSAVRVVVRNGLPFRKAADPDESVGMGLLALAERVRQAGGMLDAGPAGREFVLEAVLPLDDSDTALSGPSPVPSSDSTPPATGHAGTAHSPESSTPHALEEAP